MSDMRKWYIGVYGGEAQARTCSPHPNEVIRDCEGDTFVLSRDHMAREAELKEGIAKHWQVICDQRAKIDALQQRLTAADERADVLERDAARYRWLRDVNVGPHMIDRLLFQTVSDDCNPPYRDMKHGVDLDAAIDAELKP